MMEELDVFIKRLKKIGINLELAGNIPWIYIININGKTVREKYQSEHGFVIGYYPIRNNQKFTFSDINEIFKLIRKYK